MLKVTIWIKILILCHIAYGLSVTNFFNETNSLENEVLVDSNRSPRGWLTATSSYFVTKKRMYLTDNFLLTLTHRFSILHDWPI